MCHISATAKAIEYLYGEGIAQDQIFEILEERGISSREIYAGYCEIVRSIENET